MTGFLMLALLDVSHNSARYGALFLIIPAIVSGISLTLANVTDNCCGDIKKVIFSPLQETRVLSVTWGHADMVLSQACAVGLYQAFGSTMGIITGTVTFISPGYIEENLIRGVFI